MSTGHSSPHGGSQSPCLRACAQPHNMLWINRKRWKSQCANSKPALQKTLHVSACSLMLVPWEEQASAGSPPPGVGERHGLELSQTKSEPPASPTMCESTQMKGRQLLSVCIILINDHWCKPQSFGAICYIALANWYTRNQAEAGVPAFKLRDRFINTFH